MGFASSRNLFLLSVASASVGVLVSCATQEQQLELPSKSVIKFESIASLRNWHDVTHKSYYGLKTTVKSLVIEPAVLEGESSQAVSDGWELEFNKAGRLTAKRNLDDGQKLRTVYSYSEQGQLKFVASYKDDKLWRTSNFIYKNKQLVKIQFTDKTNREQFEVKVARQEIPGGWFEIQEAISTPGLPAYSKFLKDNSLVWSNKGDINNGLGELYYIRTVDGVTSSDVVNAGTLNMKEQGGYRYVYRKDGLLKAVESYNAHKSRLFHKTSYQYNDLALLVSENRKVLDSSPFNHAVDESVNYEYLQVDKKGNWIKRKLRVTTEFQHQTYLESRKINYY